MFLNIDVVFSEKDVRNAIVKCVRNAIEIIRWYDWQDEQQRRRDTV
jgi:hypothetical protein